MGHETEHWSVYRRYLEFYVLESKLTEFHGNVSPLGLKCDIPVHQMTPKFNACH